MRIAILSDIHGNLPALEAVAADLKTRGCEHIVNLGDSLSGPLWPLETAQFLIAENWPTIAGNHERQLLTLLPEQQNASDRFTAEQLNDTVWHWLDSLPATLRIDNGILLCHGTPHNDSETLLETLPDPACGMHQPQLASEYAIAGRLLGIPVERNHNHVSGIPLEHKYADLIACGHSHIPRSLTLDGMTLINPGSVGLQAYTDDHPHPYYVETGSPHARYAIIEHTAHGYRSELISLPYAHHHSADKARCEGRYDWQVALAYGRHHRSG